MCPKFRDCPAHAPCLCVCCSLFRSTSLPADSRSQAHPSADPLYHPCVYLVRGQPAVCPSGKMWPESYTFPGRAVPALDTRSGEGKGSQHLLMPACPGPWHPFIPQGPWEVTVATPLCVEEMRVGRHQEQLVWSQEPPCSCPQHGMGVGGEVGGGNCSCPSRLSRLRPGVLIAASSWSPGVSVGMLSRPPRWTLL